MKTLENVRLALESIKGNLLRTVITCSIIALGILALVGILTSVDAIKISINKNFSEMGANSFNIDNRGSQLRVHGGRRREADKVPINFREAMDFKSRFAFPSMISVSANVSSNFIVKQDIYKTDPNVNVIGIDENYLSISGYSIASGRGLNNTDLDLTANNAIIGQDIVDRLFGINNPIGQKILIGANTFQVIGTLEEKGNSMGASGDRVIYIPLTTAKERYLSTKKSYTITVGVSQPEMLDPAIGEATAMMRKVRRQEVGEPNNFEISKSDSLATQLVDNLAFMNIAAIIIGIITLSGAAIGLMNIMLVSVTERTREVGIRKALGATPTMISRQFLIEALVICQIGGLMGIVFGILVGNIISYNLGIGFIIPWAWMILGVTLCFIVGIVAGFIPARRASRLDPIESLRFE